MVTDVLFTGLFFLLVIGLLVAFVYSLGKIFAEARTHDALAKETPEQQRLLTASFLNWVQH